MKIKNLLTTLFVLFTFIGFAQQDPPLNENFDSSSEFPTNWTQDAGTHGWLVKPWANSAPNALAVPYSTEEKNDWLFTPGLNLISGKIYLIQFMIKAPGWSGVSEALELKVGLDATSVAMLDLVWQDGDLIQSEYDIVTVSYTPTEDNVFYFGWHAYSGADIDYIAIDDIKIFEAPSVDIHLSSTTMPNGELLGNSPVSQLEYTNWGNTQATFDINLTINDGSTDVFTETVSVTDLAVAEIRELSFSDYFPTQAGVYSYTFTATAGGDTNELDNILIKNIAIIDGCEHKITLKEEELEEGWFGANLTVTTNGVEVLSNITLASGATVDYIFPSENNASIELTFTNDGDLPEYCVWNIFDGENNLILDGIGDETGNIIQQTTTGNCPATIHVKKLNEIDATISPNPTSGKINIKANGTYNVTIVDITGKTLNNFTIYDEQTIKIADKGVFFLNFKSEEKSFTKKVVVE